jgi:hypothetical protein
MAHGEYRQTADVDIVAHLMPEHVKPLVAALESEYYIDEAMIVDSLKSRQSFNVMHLDTMFKVDVFPLKSRPYDAEAAGRRQRELLEIQPPLEVYVASAEDILLAKLEWYRLGGGSSERQWRDILGICKMQFFDLDFEYLEKWSQEIKVKDLLERAFDEAGLKEAS